MTEPLLARFDALLFDLDGVVYVGPLPVPYAAESIARRASRRAWPAATSPTTPPARLRRRGRPPGRAGHRGDGGRRHHLPAGGGVAAPATSCRTGPGSWSSAGPASTTPSSTAGTCRCAPWPTPRPPSCRASPRTCRGATWPRPPSRCGTGLPWIATNPDLTFPAPGGIAPGNGALVRLVAETVGRGPDAVAGKPEPPLLREAIRRTRAQRPLMVGDRLDTDIAAGARVGIPSLLVFTGVTTLAELLAAIPEERPDVPGRRSARAARRPTPRSSSTRDRATCRRVERDGDRRLRSTCPWAATRGTPCAPLPRWRGVAADAGPAV